MASKYLRGKVWWVIYYKNGKKVQQSLKTKDKAVANYRKNEIENTLARGDSPFPDKSVLIGQVFDEFIESRKATSRPRTVEYYQQTLSPFIKSISRSARISSITDKSVIDYINAKKSPKECTVWHIIKALNTMMLFAVSRGYLQKNPLTMKKPRVQKRTPEAWTAEETRRIIEGAGEAEAMIRLNLYFGLRPSELTRLAWEDIDLKSGVLTVQEAKDGEFRRILIHPEAARILEGMGPGSGPLFPDMDDNRMRKTADRIRRAAKVKHIKRFWYSIRHTFATEYYKQTGDLKGLQEILGHSKITMTEIYVNPHGDHKRKQIGKLKYSI